MFLTCTHVLCVDCCSVGLVLNRARFQKPPVSSISASEVVRTMAEGNFVGIVFARSLHYQVSSTDIRVLSTLSMRQRSHRSSNLSCSCLLVVAQFYAWYAQHLPLLAWSTGLPDAARIAILVSVELCWNIYPPRAVSSAILFAMHVFLLLALLSSRGDPKRHRKLKA